MSEEKAIQHLLKAENLIILYLFKFLSGRHAVKSHIAYWAKRRLFNTFLRWKSYSIIIAWIPQLASRSYELYSFYSNLAVMPRPPWTEKSDWLNFMSILMPAFYLCQPCSCVIIKYNLFFHNFINQIIIPSKYLLINILEQL